MDKFKNPVGIGGWLLVAIFGMINAMYFYGLGVVSCLDSMTRRDFWYCFNSAYDAFNPVLGLRVIGIMLMFLVLLGWSALCVYLILKKSSSTKIVCLRYYAVQLAFGIIAAILSTISIGGHESWGYSKVVVLICIVPLIWMMYFLKSKRVTNTFGGYARVVAETTFDMSPEEEIELSKLLFRRFCARVADMVLGALCAGMFYALSLRGMESDSVLLRCLGCVLAFSSLIVLIVPDCVMYMSFGQTFGKHLLGIRVMRNDGRPLTRLEYMRRSGNALFHIGCPIFFGWPIFALLAYYSEIGVLGVGIVVLISTFAFQYRRVLSTGRTSYDAVYDINVVSRRFDARRFWGVLLLIIGIASLLVYSAFCK